MALSASIRSKKKTKSQQLHRSRPFSPNTQWRSYIILAFIFLLTLASCKKKLFLYPSQNITLYSLESEDIENIVLNGEDKLTGTNCFYQDGKIVSYPALYLSNRDPLSGKNLILLDFPLQGQSADSIHLELYINYAESTLYNLELKFYPILKEWNKNTICYSQLFEENYLNEHYFIRYYFQIEGTPLPERIKEIPLQRQGQFLICDLTPLKHSLPLQQWHGIAVIPADFHEYTYVTHNQAKQIAPTGTIEIASAEWENWDGLPKAASAKQLKIKNRGYQKKKYLPKLILSTLTNKPSSFRKEKELPLSDKSKDHKSSRKIPPVLSP